MTIVNPIDLLKKKKKEPFVDPGKSGSLQSIPASETSSDKTKEKDKPVTTFTSSETGEVSGVTINGRTFFGVNEKDITKITAAENQKRVALGQKPLPIMSQAIAAQQEEQARRNAALASQVGQLDPNILAGAQGEGTDLRQLGGAAVGGALPAIGAGIAGSLAAAPATGGVSLILTAGLVATAITQIKGNLKSQQQGKITAGGQALADGQANLKRLVTAANRDPANADLYFSMFNEQLSYIERDYGILQLDTQGFLKDLTGVDGTPQLADYGRFYEFQRDFSIAQMQAALLNPNPSADLSLLEGGIENEQFAE